MLQTTAWLSRAGGILCALSFSLVGWIFVDYPGIQTDEVMFAGPLFRAWRFFSVRFFHHNVPVMTMSYNGTLKTWLYAPLLLTWHPNAILIRMPAVLMGAATILIFSALLNRVHGRRAAWVGCILLATDTSFLLMTTYDWGPVALQHLLLVAMMFFAVHWFQTGAEASLGAAALCCGLALWDKAVFVWVLSGLLIGLLLFISDLRRRWNWRGTFIVCGALAVGSLPLIVYNLESKPRFATIRTNGGTASDRTSVEFEKRVRLLQSTWNGSALLGYVVNEDSAPRPKAPVSFLERASFTLRSVAGEHRSNLMFSAFCGALLLVPILWGTRARRPLLFCLIAIVIAWIHMAMAGGGSPHHAVLLWPLPHLFLALAFTEASLHWRFGKWVLAAVLGILGVSNLLVTNQYLFQFIRNGAGDNWTDAIYPLADGLKQAHASNVAVIDWGLSDSLCVLGEGELQLRSVDDPVMSAEDSKMLADPNAIWVEHAPGHEALQGVNERVAAKAREAGYQQKALQTYDDRNGRPMFQTFRFTRYDVPSKGIP